MKALENKPFRITVVVALVLLTLGSTGMFVFALTRPGTGEDPKNVKLSVDVITQQEIQTCAYKVYGDDT
jgi:hypothetical protein